MKQQINLYQAEFRPQMQVFKATVMLQIAAAVCVAMGLIYLFALDRVQRAETELTYIASQEQAALERLTNLRPLIASVTGEMSWSERLDEALATLEQRQAILTLVQGTSLGDTDGFSRHLRALAGQHIDGLWLTSIVLSPAGDQTLIAGRAIRPELVPLYVQELTAEPPFAAQRFHRFQIEGPEEGQGGALHFSMQSQVVLAASAGGVQ